MLCVALIVSIFESYFNNDQSGHFFYYGTCDVWQTKGVWEQLMRRESKVKLNEEQ
jgi:hypothetical protein